ncbi:hypothetical protein CCMSSC00406_0008227 [Pleurotus cornucopiae]|uniref:Uncharacterized protein n=1 Tax=Pleurotus cornucopiae TaxID=5321 RepID=A0ACB7INY0_PLECO|nr:hypothetical protein CCMSSC00406_0008227 [Pleurotus cornucopiae]
MTRNYLSLGQKPNAPPSRELSYTTLGWAVDNIIPPEYESLAAAPLFNDAATEHYLAFGKPPLPIPARINSWWSQVDGGRIIPQDVESITPAMSSNCTMPPNGGYQSFPRELYPMQTGAGQVTANGIMAQDGGSATLWNEGANVKFEVPSGQLPPPSVYPPWIAPERGQEAGWNHATGMALTSMSFNGAMGPVGYSYPLFPSFSTPGQVRQSVPDVNLNAMVVRPTISTPAAALEAERRRVHPHKYFCHTCPDGFTSKANRDREQLLIPMPESQY